MTNQAKLELLAVLASLLNIETAAVKPAKKFTPKSSYKAANKFTPKHQDGLSDRQIKNDVAVAKAFNKKGFLVTPRVDALTYKGWLKVGMRVKQGERGTFVKGVGTVFHSGQVSRNVPISLVTGQPVEAVIQ